MNILNLLFLLLISSLYVVRVTFARNNEMNKNNPFTAKASLIRYWNTKISNDIPKPNFFLSKASPVGPTELAILSGIASDSDSLSTHLDSLCSLAHLFCSFDAKNDVVSGSAQNDVVSSGSANNFAVYSNRRFANYGASLLGGLDSFRNYSAELNSPNDSFRKYGRASASRAERFSSYSADSNVAATNFTSYAAAATGGSGEFTAYHDRVNVPSLRFSSYDSAANGHRLGFASYGSETNSGSESFLSYAKNGNGAPAGFESYAEGSNTVGSGFSGYGELGHGGNDSFKGYGISGNDPRSEFRSYGAGGNSGDDEFRSYRAGSNVGSDSFLSYARNSNSGRAIFVNYGKSFNLGNDTFKEYGRGASGRVSVGFVSYSLGRSFKDYAKNGVVFKEYDDTTAVKGSSVISKVEEGKFFREGLLKKGSVMKMPDIGDKMPKRAFLPRVLEGKIPFSQAKSVFHARVGSTTERVIANTVEECERAPSPGERKKCVGSGEDMIDFVVSVLGRDVVVRATENINGSRGEVAIGEVRAINGGGATVSVSCHQSLYPYLLYYCHAVHKVRVYDVDILDVKSREKFNRGIAVCHLDTSSWAPGHGAFVALGSGPGRIEVCHWIFENDMSWTIADH